MKVTVVIPTYNRAHILEQTLPSYLQPDVSKLVLVDDCSVDNTQAVVENLCRRFPSKILAIRNDQNRKQAFSKNRGKELANTRYVYFGDDDSILRPGSIGALLETLQTLNADIVGAVALYCAPGQTPDERWGEYSSQDVTTDPLQFVDLRYFRFSLTTRRPATPIALPVLQASFLARIEWCQRVSFDTEFTGNCYCEETDFLLCCYRAGARIYLDGRAAQINLEPAIASGGVRSLSRAVREYHSVLNVSRFVRKHRVYFEKDLNVGYYRPLLSFIGDRVAAAGRRLWHLGRL